MITVWGRTITIKPSQRSATTKLVPWALRVARLLFVAAIALHWAVPAHASNSGLVSASGTHFMLNGKPFFYTGTNCYYLMVYAADPGLRSCVDEVLEESYAVGLTVIRTWAFNDGAAQWNALQTSPGVYEESVFRGLDYVLHKADQLGIRVILPLVNNWPDYGGMNQYVAWAGAASHDDFYTNADCKTYYKNHISTVLNRVNTLNGRVYKNDPTVFAWELGNEPEAESKGVGVLNAWVQEMSDYVKSLDANHMVAVGIEGFYSSDAKNHNTWMKYKGTDFITTQQHSSVDFAVSHSWPDWWGLTQTQTMNFVQQQITDAHTVLKKPYVLEEFGKKRPLTTRDSYYQAYLDLIYNNRAAGSNFWILYHDAYQDYDGFGVYYPADASTVAIIQNNAQQMARLIPDRALSAVGDLRSVADGTTVYTTNPAPVTAVFDGCFYIEDPMRAAAIRIQSDETVSRGYLVAVCGELATSEVDRYIACRYLDIIHTGTQIPGPLSMQIRCLGGAPPDNWPGPESGVGTYNVGLLARVAGKILDSSSEFFFVDDGSGQSVKVYGARPAGTCAVATGIVGYEILWQRVIRTRDALDVQGF